MAVVCDEEVHIYFGTYDMNLLHMFKNFKHISVLSGEGVSRVTVVLISFLYIIYSRNLTFLKRKKISGLRINSNNDVQTRT